VIAGAVVGGLVMGAIYLVALILGVG
jgi:hypothetical protein